jgi:hypothetical protein
MKVLLSMFMICCVGCLSEPGEEDLGGAEGEGTSTVDQASVSEGFVAGSGVVTDDFGDEGPVDVNSHPSSLAAGMWQAILYADGAHKGLNGDGTGAVFAPSDIDCDFGPDTKGATQYWQRNHAKFTGNDVDGSAGPMTLSVADGSLFNQIPGSTQSVIRYNGSVHSILFIRKEGTGSANHAYQALGVDRTLRVISYGSISSCSSSSFLGTCALTCGGHCCGIDATFCSGTGVCCDGTCKPGCPC